MEIVGLRIEPQRALVGLGGTLVIQLLQQHVAETGQRGDVPRIAFERDRNPPAASSRRPSWS